MKQFRKYDEKQDIIFLNEEYLFAYTKSDGFSERLLKAELVVDYDYNYKFELNAFHHEKKTKNNSNSLIEKGKIPDNIIFYLEDLLSSDYLSLKKYYDFETFSVTDIGSQQFLFNLEKTTTNIHIIDELPEECFTSNVEKKLFEFNNYLKKYVEDKYQNWIK